MTHITRKSNLLRSPAFIAAGWIALSVISLIVFGRIGLIISAFLGVTLLVFHNAQEKIAPANLNTLSLILVAIALGTPIALVIKYPVFTRKMLALMTAAASTLAQL